MAHGHDQDYRFLLRRIPENIYTFMGVNMFGTIIEIVLPSRTRFILH